jgi:hypothetical protein
LCCHDSHKKPFSGLVPWMDTENNTPSKTPCRNIHTGSMDPIKYLISAVLHIWRQRTHQLSTASKAKRVPSQQHLRIWECRTYTCMAVHETLSANIAISRWPQKHIDNAAISAQATSANSAPFGPNSSGKNLVKGPRFIQAYNNQFPIHHLINNTLAGVAQLVERVALITAKRSTSRSWVRAPPSAIPISQAQ